MGTRRVGTMASKSASVAGSPMSGDSTSVGTRTVATSAGSISVTSWLRSVNTWIGLVGEVCIVGTSGVGAMTREAA